MKREIKIGVEPGWMPLSHRIFDFLTNINAWRLNRGSVRHQIKNRFMVNYEEARDIHLNWEHQILPVLIMDAVMKIHEINLKTDGPVRLRK